MQDYSSFELYHVDVEQCGCSGADLNLVPSTSSGSDRWFSLESPTCICRYMYVDIVFCGSCLWMLVLNCMENNMGDGKKNRRDAEWGIMASSLVVALFPRPCPVVVACTVLQVTESWEWPGN